MPLRDPAQQHGALVKRIRVRIDSAVRLEDGANDLLD